MGLVSFLGGGSKSKSQSTQDSYNKAYEPVSTAFSPMLPYAQQGASSLAALLSGDFSGFNKYKEGTGFDFAMNRGLGAIDANAAGRRMVHSGSALKALEAFGTGLQSTYADKYLQNLTGLSNLGLNAGGALTGAGSVSKSQSTSESKQGVGLLSVLSSLGTLAAGASDIRLKKDVTKLGVMDSGLGVYQFTYLNDDGPYIGVMAHEVAELYPEALGPVIAGYMTVQYDKLPVSA